MKSKGCAKMVAILALVLLTANSLWFTLPAAPCYAEGGYGVTAGGSSGSGIPSSYNSLVGKTDHNGVLTRDTTTKTDDGKCQLTIPEGTKALNRLGDRLSSILMVAEKDPPSPPPDANVVGKVYDILPNGASFDPPVTITFCYDTSAIPEGFDEENLIIAYWDGTNWINLQGPFIIDTVNDTISASTGHLTEFAVIASTRPAAFTTSSLSISPPVIDTGQEITIDVIVTNTGDLAGSHEVILKSDNEVIDSRTVTLAGHASQKVNFSTTASYAAGDHIISINELSGTVTIKELIPPAPVPTITPSPALTPPAPVPTITSAPAETQPAPVPAPVTPPEPAPVPLPTSAEIPINWWLIGGIIAVVIIILLGIWQLINRRNRG